jgi:hypothetical protein
LKNCHTKLRGTSRGGLGIDPGHTVLVPAEGQG